MLVSKIEFNNVTFSSDRQRHSANILLTTDVAHLSLVARTDLPETTPRPDIALALVRDAIRQVRRMPEYRRNGADVQVANDATRAALQRA